MSSTGKAKKKKTGRRVFSVFRQRDNKSHSNDDKNNNDSFRTVNISTNDQTPSSLPSTISPKLKTLLEGMNDLAEEEISELRKLGVMIQSPTVNNSKGGKSKGKTDKLSSLVSQLTRKDSRRVRPVDLLVEISCGDSIRL